MTRSGVFITATDTHVGKTWLACQLIPLLTAQSLPLRVRKPVESGCQYKDDSLFPEDAHTLLAATDNTETLEQICRYRLQSVASPSRAAELENIPLQIADLVAACAVNATTFLLVEGAGGFYSPLAQDGLNADLAEQLQLPLLLVCPDRLGCIGQALLVLDAAQRRGLPVLAVVVNQTKSKPNNKDLDNAHELAGYTDVPVFRTRHVVSNQYSADNQQQISQLASIMIACQQDYKI